MLDLIYKFFDHQQSMPTTRVRNIFIYFTSSLVLAFLTFLFLILAIELALRATKNSSFLAYQPCLFVKWTDEFFSYRPNCESQHKTENGLVLYHFNELGFRDRSLSYFSRGSILFLGDSITKGLFLKEEQTIPRALEIGRAHV